MLYLFILAWLLSPLILIPVTIVLSRRKTKLQSFVWELFDKGRISSVEYSELKVEKGCSASAKKSLADCGTIFSDSTDHSEMPGKPVLRSVSDIKPPSPHSENSSEIQGKPVLRSEPDTKAPSSPVINTPEKKYMPDDNIVTEKAHIAPEMPAKPVFRDEEHTDNIRQTAPRGAAAPKRQPVTDRRAGAMSVLMTIGIIFVILAGLVFSTAVWVNLGNFGRTCAVGTVAAMFFGISAFSRKKLSLESTSFAFYTLGTFFSAITLITAGFFGLMGSFLSVRGGGSSVLYSAAAMVICLLSAKGYKIFGKAAAAFISVFGGAIAAVLLLVQISDGLGMFALLLSLLTLGVNTAVFTLNVNISEKWEKPVVTAASVLYAVSLLCGISSVFTDSYAANACAGVFVLRSAAIAVMGFKEHCIYRKRLPSAISLLSGIFFTASLMQRLSGSHEVFALALTVFAMVFIGAFFTFDINIPEEWDGTVRFSALMLLVSGLISSFSALFGCFGEWSAICFIISGLYIVCSFAVGILASYGHKFYEKAPSAFASLFTGMTFSVMLIAELSESTAAAALMITVLFLVIINVIYSAAANLPEGWKIASDIAAAVLGIISTLCSFFVLCDSFGHWDTACFVIAALFIIQSAAVSAMAYKGHHIYGKTVFGVLSQLAGIAFALLTLGELSSGSSQFALFLSVFAVVYLNFAYTFKLDKPKDWKIPVDLSAAFLCTSAVLYSGCIMTDSFGSWTYEHFIIASLFIIQSAAVSAMAYKGHHIYGKTVFGVLSQLAGIAFALLTLGELSSDSSQFALFLSVFAVFYLNLAYTFKLDKPEGWKIPVDLSAAFLCISAALYSGCIMTDSFGNWTYEYFIIAALFIAMSLVSAEMAYFGHSEYSKTRWAVFSHITGLIFTVLLLSELTANEDRFILCLALITVLFTTVSHITLDHSPEKWRTVTRVSGMLMNAVSAIASAGMLMGYFAEWNACCFITASLYILYTLVWGIRLESSLLKGTECMISSLTLYNIYCLMTEKFAGAAFILVCMLFALALIHHFSKPVRTVFSDILLTAAVMAASLCLTWDNNDILRLSGFALLLILLIIKATEKENSLARLFGILLPLPVTGMVFSAVMLPDIALPFRFEFAVNAALLAIIAAAVLKIGKRSGTVFYSFALTASAMALIGLESGSFGVQLLLLGVSIMLTVLFGISANDLPSLITMLCSALSVKALADMAEPAVSIAVHILSAAVFAAVCAAASRVFFGNKLLEKENGRFCLDTCCTGILFCIPMLSGISGEWELFLVLTLIALFAANLARKEHNDDFNRAALTAGSGVFTLALINRPFLTVSDELFSFKLTLGLICIFGFVFSRIWKKYPKVSENFPTAVYGISFICLIIEALSHQNLFNTLIVLGVSLAILLYSFIRKKKRWFAVSSIALTGLTLYIFRDFFRMIDWWVYLLAVGLLLIAVSSANEYFIKKGRELKEKAGRFFEDWTW